ncbi:MAG: hypothetical protein ACNFW9_04700 [Candidatus Kerfeldbacteria bacterium]
MKTITIKKISVVSLLVLLTIIVSGCTNAEDEANNNTFTAVEIVTGTAALKIKDNTDHDLAIIKAKELYRIAFYNGDDFSSGPCLSNAVIPGWVADIAHNPRQAIDDQPANQCSAFLDGTAKHFVELDLSGELIRAE